MKVKRLHGWQVSITQAMELQEELAVLVSMTSEITKLRFIAGADISVRKDMEMATGVVVVLEHPGFKLVETKVVNGRLDFPYVPGLLSFRESPLILEACEEFAIILDVLMVDGQGIAHPRWMGLASHLGFFKHTNYWLRQIAFMWYSSAAGHGNG